MLPGHNTGLSWPLSDWFLCLLYCVDDSLAWYSCFVSIPFAVYSYLLFDEPRSKNLSIIDTKYSLKCANLLCDKVETYLYGIIFSQLV
jgi:hypothetical protein